MSEWMRKVLESKRQMRKQIAAKERDPKADTTAREREIDRLVYELYGLTGAI